MNVHNKQTVQQNNAMCKTCQKFYANEAFEGMCSGCFKKHNQNHEQKATSVKVEVISSPLQTEVKEPEKIEQIKIESAQVDRKRCYQCKKKVGFLGIECRCKFVFCNSHRLPQEHSCEFDHRTIAQQKLKKEIVKVYNGKIADI